MRVQSFLQMSNTWRVGLIVLAVIASLVAGVFPIAGYSPLIAGGLVIAVAIGAVLLQKPVWALYAAVFVVFLPYVRGQTPLAQALDRMGSLLTRSATLIALASWLLGVITKRRRIAWTSTALLMLGFLAWGMVTLSWAPSLSRGVGKIGQYAFRLTLYLVLIANEIDTKETLDGLMRTLALNTWVLVLAGVGAILFGGYRPGTRLDVLGMNENELGLRILVTVPGVLWHVMRAPERQRALRMVQSIVLVLLVLVLVALSGSRGSAISWLATLLAFWFWKPTRPWGKVGLLILAVVVISTPFIFSTTARRFSEVESGPLGGRLTIWQASWLVVRDHPWGGVGIGNAGYVLSSYLNTIPSRWRHSEQIVSHNPILQIWIETGTIGMLLYLGALASAVWLFARQYYRHSKRGARSLTPYFALVSCMFVGVMLSWIKGGGMEYDPSYFLLLALLLIPSHLDVAKVDCMTKNRIQDVGTTEL